MRVFYYSTMLCRWIFDAITFICTDRVGVLTKTTRRFVTNFGDLMGSSQMF